MDTMTPTVVSRPVPASAIANSDSVIDPAAEQEGAVHRRADQQRGVDRRLKADETPARMTVAGPVSEDFATSSTGRRLVSVK